MARILEIKDTSEGSSRAVDIAAQYFAYIAGTGAAVAIAAVTMVYTAHTALSLVDTAAFPERHPMSQIEKLPAQPDKIGAASNTFAMLPSSMPLNMKNDVLSSNF